MQDPKNSFSPLLIDQQMEHPTASLPRGEAHLVHDLQAMYDQENSAAIHRVWTRLALQRSRQPGSPQPEQLPASISSLGMRDARTIQRKREPRQASPFVQRLSLLAAVLVVTLLVGSLVFVFSLSRGGPASGLPVHPTSGWGKIVYVQTMQDAGFNGLSWSPDSKRIAASNRMSAANLVRIWDATTGQHLVTVPIHEFVTTLAWSPDSKQIAVATALSVFIVDGQSGQVLRTLPVSSQSFTPASAGLIPLSSLLPGGSGGELRGLAWSPDGSHLATAFFGSLSGSSVLVWDLSIGALSRLPVQSNHGVEGVSWSSDGKYLAADTFQMAYTDPLVQRGVTVWNTATRQVVLQKNTGSLPDLNTMVAWQPGTHTLAQIGVAKVGGRYTSALLVFDGISGQMLKELIVPVSDVLAWSPDGKYLAYTAPVDLAKGNAATILDASNWHTVYIYKTDQNLLNALAWSPNGHYIATGETVLENNSYVGVVRVWVALDQA
ncbi:MAG TPA: WD40 repeat domain-containing protein [Ktedonobacteraceae bacterium]